MLRKEDNGINWNVKSINQNKDYDKIQKELIDEARLIRYEIHLDDERESSLKRYN